VGAILLIGTKARKRICEPAVNGGKDCPSKKVLFSYFIFFYVLLFCMRS
jgi:hypothetical protein